MLGFEQCACLEILHLRPLINEFPVQALTTILSSLPSRNMRRVTVHLQDDWQVDRVLGTIDASNPSQYELLRYQRLDDALCLPILGNVEVVVCLVGPYSTGGIAPWEENLSMLLPKFYSLARLRVERAETMNPWTRWLELRD